MIAAYVSGSYKKTARCMAAKWGIFKKFWLQDMSRAKPQTFFLCLFVLLVNKTCEEEQHLEGKELLLTRNDNPKKKGI